MKTFNSNESSGPEKANPEDAESDLLRSFIDLDINGMEVGHDKQQLQEKTVTSCISSQEKLHWPPSKKVQDEFRKSAHSDLSHLTDLVPKFDRELKCSLHNNKFDSRDPIKHVWVQSKSVKIYDTEWLPDIERTIYYRPTVGDCKCYQTWTGASEKLLNISKNQIGKTVHIITYKMLLSYTWNFCKSGSTRHGYYQAHNNRMIFQYGVLQENILPWHIWNTAVTCFWEEILSMNPEKSFVCPDCGPRPDFLCMDGVCVGISVDNIKHQKDSDLFLQYSDKDILDAPDYKSRMFIKEKRNREIIRNACLQSKIPDLRKVNFEKDPGMLLIKDFFSALKSRNASDFPSPYCDILNDISSVSSTISMLQVNERSLIVKLIENLSLSNTQLMCEPASLNLKQELFKTFPLIYKRLDNVSRMPLNEGRIPEFVKSFYVKVLQFCKEYCDSLPVRDKSDYSQRNGEEIKTEMFPSFPLLREKNRYKADERGSRKDSDVWNGLCNKLFPENSQLTPGLFLVTCTCPQKRVYGFRKMVKGESPRIIFDLIMTRFEDQYNPTIIYDASCRAKEMGLNREPERFLKIKFASDPLHIENHTTCSASFQSTIHPEMKKLNKEACEQFNSLLRSVQSSISYMKFDNYLQALKIFIGFYNLRGVENMS